MKGNYTYLLKNVFVCLCPVSHSKVQADKVTSLPLQLGSTLVALTSSSSIYEIRSACVAGAT